MMGRSPSRRRRRRSLRRTLLLACGGLLFIGVLLMVAAWRDLLAARSRLESARSSLNQIVTHPAQLATPDGRAAAQQQLRYALDDVTIARQIVTGSLPLDVAHLLPIASAQRAGVLRLINDSGAALDAGNGLLSQADQLVVQGKINSAQVPLAQLATFETDLRATGRAISGLDRSSSGLLGPLAKARNQFNALAASTAARLENDASAIDVGRGLLGAQGPRNYFIALENNAEMRDQGAILSYAILTADQGHLDVGKHGSLLTPLQVPGQGKSTALLLKSPAPVTVPAGTETAFGGIQPTQTWASVNASADFMFSAQAIQAMYHQSTGQNVDGVIALDVPALAQVLAAVGPVSVPDINVLVTSEDASTVLLHDLYNDFPDNQQAVRKELLSEVVTEVVDKMKAGSLDPLPLAQGLSAAAAGGHLKVWSDVTSEEASLEQVGLGGGPATIGANRTFHLAVENRAATKVDYYVKTGAEQQIIVTPDGTAVVRTTIVVHNGAPAGAGPSYQLGPDHLTTTEPGEYWAWVLLWGPHGSDQPQSVPESGLQLTQTVIPRIYAGQTKAVILDTVIPNAVVKGKLVLRYVPQPRLAAPALSVTVSAPGWQLSSPATWAGAWNKTLVLTWSLHH